MKNNKKLYESIMKAVAKSVKKRLNESDDYQEIDDDMFQEALLNYGELDLADLEDELDEPIIIKNRVVKGLYADENYMYYSFEENGREYESEFTSSYLTDEECEIIYNYLIDNEDPNQEFFRSLPQDDDEYDE